MPSSGLQTLFLLKNRPFESYGPLSRSPIDVKTGYSDPADFAITRHLIHRRELAICAMVGAVVDVCAPLKVHSP
jgi:hypothetical protein